MVTELGMRVGMNAGSTELASLSLPAFEVLSSAAGWRQVGGQSDTTVCKTVRASPVTRSVTGSPPGTMSEDLRALVA